MKHALFLGCKIPATLPGYGESTRAVLTRLGVALAGDIELQCCGYPVRHIDHDAWLLSAAWNLATAEAHGVHLLAPCKCCYGSLAHADHQLRGDARVRDEVNAALAPEGLRWTGAARARHLLSVLAEDVGVDAIRAQVSRPQEGLRVAAHYGCHALRPARVTAFDDPLSPSIFEELVAATGAVPVDWPRRLDCCGNPLRDRNEALSAALTRTKIEDAREAGAETLCTACTYCQIQYDEVQPRAIDDPADRLPSLLYTDLLARALGLV